MKLVATVSAALFVLACSAVGAQPQVAELSPPPPSAFPLEFRYSHGEFFAVASELGSTACRTLPLSASVAQSGNSVSIRSAFPGSCPDVTGPQRRYELAVPLGALAPGVYFVTWQFGAVPATAMYAYGTFDSQQVAGAAPRTVPAGGATTWTLLALALLAGGARSSARPR